MMIMQTAQQPNNMNSDAHDLKNSFRVRHFLKLPGRFLRAHGIGACKSRRLCGVDTAKLGKEGIVLAACRWALFSEAWRPQLRRSDRGSSHQRSAALPLFLAILRIFLRISNATARAASTVPHLGATTGKFDFSQYRRTHGRLGPEGMVGLQMRRLSAGPNRSRGVGIRQ
jgi:hypothetical protein